MYFDPFANEADQVAPDELFQQIMDRYLNNEIEHDYTADQFIADTEALLLDSHFTENFSAFERISAQMHQLCGEDHLLANSLVGNALFATNHGDDDGHNHDAANDHSNKKKKKKPQYTYNSRDNVEAKHKKLRFDELLAMLLRKKALPKKP